MLSLIVAISGTANAPALSDTEASEPQVETIAGHPVSPFPGGIAVKNGQYAIHIDKASAARFACTPWLDVRSTDALLLIQCNAYNCQIAVLKGKVTIKNKLEKHILKLGPNCLYQSSLIREPAPESSTAKAEQQKFDQIVDPASGTPVFATTRSTTALFTVSLPALQRSRFQRYATGSNNETPAKRLSAQIVSPPTLLPYEVGASIASTLPVAPDLLHHFPPSGIIKPAAVHLAVEANQL